MSLGIPKILVNPPGSDQKFFVDVYEALFMDRILLFFHPFESDEAGNIVTLLLFLNTDNNDIYLYIDSTGGDIRTGITIYDTMRMLVPDINTLDIGLAASIASIILVAGTPGKRLAFPQAKVILQQPVMERFSASPEFMVLETEDLLVLGNTMAEIYAENLEKPASDIHDDMLREKHMTAREAQAYGIIDHLTKERKF
jgi:ATP-dependent Clp protease protease subunit